LTIVIKKGRGNRPVEALATLYLFKEGAKFYPLWIDNQTKLPQVIFCISRNNNFLSRTNPIKEAILNNY